MDTSPEFIKMCERVVEIQQHQIEDGDFYWWSVNNKVNLAFTAHTSQGYLVKHPEQWDSLRNRKVIRLLRQDQLQEMTGLSVNQLCNACRDFYKIEVWGNGYPQVFTSMEQLWLAFVMKQYNKVWNGEEWLEECTSA